MQTEVVKVKGMSCMGCVNKVKAGLENIAGVSSANVSLEQKQVTVQYDDTKAAPKQFTEAIKKAGFEVISLAKYSCPLSRCNTENGPGLGFKIIE